MAVDVLAEDVCAALFCLAAGAAKRTSEKGGTLTAAERRSGLFPGLGAAVGAEARARAENAVEVDGLPRRLCVPDVLRLVLSSRSWFSVLARLVLRAVRYAPKSYVPTSR